jgi:hypothetical protein
MTGFFRKTMRAAIPAMMTLACLAPLAGSLGAQTFAPIAPLYFTKPFGGANPLPQTIAIASAGSTGFGFSSVASTSAGGSWLSITGLVTGYEEGNTPAAAAVNVNASPALAAGTYTGQILFTNLSNGGVAITVPVTLTIAPVTTPFFDNVQGGLNFSLVTSGGNPPSQTVQIRNGGQGTLAWTLSQSTSDGGNWLNVSSTGGNAPSFVTASISVANLPNGGLLAGTYVGQLLFESGGGNVTIPVSVVVGASVMSQVNSLSFTKAFGGANPLPQVITMTSTGTAAVSFSSVVSTATGGSWLSITSPNLVTGYYEGTTPSTVQVVVNPSVALAAGTYTGQIVFTNNSTLAQAITVGVTMTIAASGTAFFDNVPGAMNFSLQTAVGVPPPQTVQIRNAGAGSMPWTLTTSTADTGAWLKVSAATGTAPSLVTVTVSPQNLPNQGLIAGTFTGELVFQTSGSSVTIPISVSVGANVIRQMNPISFSKVFGGVNPLPQIVSIAGTGTSVAFYSTVYTATGGSWLSVSSPNLVTGYLEGNTPVAASVIVNPTVTLAVGTYTGEIVFTSNTGQAVTLGVTLQVAAATNPYFDTTQGALNFSMATGGAAPASQAVQLRNAGAGSLNWTLTTTTSDGASWLTASAPNGAAPSTINVSITPSALPGEGLLAGNFTGELTFVSPAGTATVPVSVTVGTSVFVQVPALSFSKQVGGSNPLSKLFTVASTGSNFGFYTTVSTSTGGNWLSVTGNLVTGYLEGTTPDAISAVINASPTLGAGTYTGQIVFTSGAEALTVPVTLVIGTATVAAPFGSFDTPAPGATTNLAGAVGLTGWALSYAGVTTLGIYRAPVPNEPTQANGLVYIGDADFSAGSRPDVATAYPNYPYNNRGWGYLILTNELPGTNGQPMGNGTYTLHAIATDINGLSADIGTKTITVNNAGSVAPFGSIDTPTQGGLASGTRFINFGWALTPLPATIPIDGSKISVYIDSKPMGHPVYNQPRSDIEAAFPGLNNTDGAVGYFFIDTTKFANGVHTIQWSVTDNEGHTTGIGSRFFTIQN